MAKYTPVTLQGGIYSRAQIQVNFQGIADNLNDKVLYRDNPTGEPNQMEQELDMNGSRIINVGEGVNATDGVNLSQVSALFSSDQVIGTVARFREIETLVNGQVTVDFDSMNYTVGINNLSVFIDGVAQLNGVDYNETDQNTITLTVAASGGETLVAYTNETTTTDYPASNFYQDVEITATVGQSTYPTGLADLSSNPAATFVYVNGIIQTDNYTISTANEVVLDAGTASEIEAGDVVALRTSSVYYTGGSAGGIDVPGVFDNQGIVYDLVAEEWVGTDYPLGTLTIAGWEAGAVTESRVYLRLRHSATYTLPENLSGSTATVGTAPSGSAVDLDVKANNVSVGTISFADGATSATFTFTAATEVVAGQALDIVTPADVAGMEDLDISIKGSKT